jgi:hypothetical protein
MKVAHALALAALLACSSAAAVDARPSSFQARMLQAHNAERAAIGATRMVWDARLAAAADQYAAKLARTGRWGHSAPHQRVGQGENLWMGSRGAYAVEQAIADWASEKRAFRPGVFPNVSRTGSWADVGHYTQMVWPTSTRVGCSMRSSAQWDYLVCRYSEQGNVMGSRVGPRTFAGRR